MLGKSGKSEGAESILIGGKLIGGQPSGVEPGIRWPPGTRSRPTRRTSFSSEKGKRWVITIVKITPKPLVPDSAGADSPAELRIQRHQVPFEKLNMGLDVFLQSRQNASGPVSL